MADNLRERFDQYIGELFAPEDEILRSIKTEIERNGLPTISVQPYDGYLLAWLVRLAGVRKVVELGTLGGYSGTWIARALPDDGKLITLEKSSKHAAVARANFEKAGLSEKVEVREGDARDRLAELVDEGPFDMVFIDADKDSYVDYLEWAAGNLRSGGLVTAHNTYRGGNVLSPESDGDQMIVAFNQKLASDDRLDGFIIPIGDGMAVGVKK